MTTSLAKVSTNQTASDESSRQSSASSPGRSSLPRLFYADWFRCLALALLGFVVHVPALQGQRIWDDKFLVGTNPFIKSPLLILESFRHYLFVDSYSSHYRPIQNLSYFIDYLFWNTNEFGFHLTNVLLHVASSILLYFLLRKLILSFRLQTRTPASQAAIGRAPWLSQASFLVALLWAVHPVHSAAIDYISGRADSLAFVFACTGWLLFFRAQTLNHSAGRKFAYFLAAASGLLALCSREIALVWILLFICHVVWIERRIGMRVRFAAVVTCFALALIYLCLRQLPAARPSYPSIVEYTPAARAVLMLRALGDYGRLMVWPSNLYMERTVVSEPGHYQNLQGWRNTIDKEYLSVLGLLVLAALIFGCLRNDRWRRVRIFGAVWFLAAYLPISNIVELNATAAEHWLYLPSVGLLIFLVGWAFQLPVRFRPLITSCVILAVVALTVRSFVRSGDWSDEETFYRRTFEAGSRSARVAVNLGQAYTNRGAYAEAERIFRFVLDQNPDYPVAQNNLAAILARQGKNKEAEALYALIEKNSKRTRQEFPRSWLGALNLAYVRHGAHNDDAALEILERAHNDYPEVWELIRLKAEIVRERQGPEAALSLVQDFARKNWWHYGAAVALGRLYAQSGNEASAENALSLASRLDIHDSEALRLLAEMRLRENRLEEAFQIQRRAVARQPDQPSLYVALSDILTKMGRDADARVELVKAVQLRSLVPNPALPN